VCHEDVYRNLFIFKLKKSNYAIKVKHYGNKSTFSIGFLKSNNDDLKTFHRKDNEYFKFGLDNYKNKFISPAFNLEEKGNHSQSW